MKRFFICLLLALAGCKPGADKEAATVPEKKPPAEFEVQRDARGEAIVTLSPETQKRIDLKVAALGVAQRQPEWLAYGSVLDPASLAAMHGEIVLDEMMLQAAQKVAQRAKALFEQDENVPRKTWEAAENDQSAAEIKLRTAERSLALEWGQAIAGLRGTDRRDLVDRVSARHTALLQVELPMGQIMTGPPSSIRVSLAGRDRDYAATMMSPAPKADPKSLGQGFLLRIDDADAALAPGAAVQARLRLAGPAQKGALIPEAAIVRSADKTWVYLAEANDKFRRREVFLDAPMEQGWFATNGVAAADRVVVQAAQLLWSEEQKAEIQGN